MLNQTSFLGGESTNIVDFSIKLGDDEVRVLRDLIIPDLEEKFGIELEII